MKKYTVFDNPEFLDRYTIIDRSGDMLGLSETGAGVDQFGGNCVDNYMFNAFGYGWRNHCDVKKIVKSELPRIIEEFRRDGNIGKEIAFSSLPKEMQVHISNRFKQ
jgi:hypothetical protein